MGWQRRAVRAGLVAATAGLWAAGGCASSGVAPGATAAPATPPAGNRTAGDPGQDGTPPPRGMPQPRLADTPAGDPLQPGGDVDERGEERFLTLHGEEHKQRQQQRASAPRAGVTVPSVDVVGAQEPAACNGLSRPERMSCPLNSAGVVEKVSDAPEGVRLEYRRNPGMTADKVRRIIDCQRALAAANPGNPPSCSFVDVRTKFSVSERRERVVVDVLRAPDVEAGMLREQVRAAFRKQGR